MTITAKMLEPLKQVSTATLTTVLLKKGLRNVWMRGADAAMAGSRSVVAVVGSCGVRRGQMRRQLLSALT